MEATPINIPPVVKTDKKIKQYIAIFIWYLFLDSFLEYLQWIFTWIKIIVKFYNYIFFLFIPYVACLFIPYVAPSSTC